MTFPCRPTQQTGFGTARHIILPTAALSGRASHLHATGTARYLACARVNTPRVAAGLQRAHPLIPTPHPCLPPTTTHYLPCCLSASCLPANARTPGAARCRCARAACAPHYHACLPPRTHAPPACLPPRAPARTLFGNIFLSDAILPAFRRRRASTGKRRRGGSHSHEYTRATGRPLTCRGGLNRHQTNGVKRTSTCQRANQPPGGDTKST